MNERATDVSFCAPSGLAAWFAPSFVVSEVTSVMLTSVARTTSPSSVGSSAGPIDVGGTEELAILVSSAIMRSGQVARRRADGMLKGHGLVRVGEQ